MPRPRADLDTKPFWDACDEGRFVYQRCLLCSGTRWPPGPMCPHCQSTEADWVESAGRGHVYSWIVATHPVDPGLVDQVPYIVAMIDLEGGVRVVGNVEGCAPEEVEAGMPVDLFFEELDNGHLLPNFRKARSEGSRSAEGS